MSYDKLTVDKFAVKLREGGYENLAGARRAVGKAAWTEKDKNHARSLADAHFGAATSKPSVKPAKKSVPAAKPAKSTPPKKAAKPAAKAAKPAAQKAHAPRRTPVVPALSAPAVYGTPVLEEATRQSAASAVMTTYKNSGCANALEKEAYDLACAEYIKNASADARRLYDAATRGIPTPGPLTAREDESDAAATSAVGVDEVLAPPAGAPIRVPVQPANGQPQFATQEEKDQYDRLQRAHAIGEAMAGRTAPTS